MVLFYGNDEISTDSCKQNIRYTYYLKYLWKIYELQLKMIFNLIHYRWPKVDLSLILSNANKTFKIFNTYEKGYEKVKTCNVLRA